MIRHGQASFGKENYDSLSPMGVVQADLIAKHLLKSGRVFDMICTGEMERQRKTADALLRLYNQHKIPVPELIADKSFNEYDSESVMAYHIPRMVAEDPSLQEALNNIYNDKMAFQNLFQQAMNRWTSGEHDTPGAPIWRDFKKRVQKGIGKIMKQYGAKKTLAVFTSGGPISVTIQKALGLSDSNTMEVSWQIMNASITRFKYNQKGIMLAGFNDISHLELEGDARLLTYR